VFLSTPCKDLTFWDFWWVQFIWWKTVMLRSGKPVFCVSMVCVYVHGISNGVSPAVCDFVLFFLYYTHWHSVFPSEFSTKWWFLNGFWVFHVGFWLFNIYVNCLFLCPNLCFFFSYVFVWILIRFLIYFAVGGTWKWTTKFRRNYGTVKKSGCGLRGTVHWTLFFLSVLSDKPYSSFLVHGKNRRKRKLGIYTSRKSLVW
jgi:hypothetical protein